MYSHLHASGWLTSPHLWPWKQWTGHGRITPATRVKHITSFVIPTNWHGKIWHIFWQYLVDIICSDYIYIFWHSILRASIWHVYSDSIYIFTHIWAVKKVRATFHWTSAIKSSRQLKTWTLEERSQYLENQGIVTAKQDLHGMAGAVWQAWFLH